MSHLFQERLDDLGRRLRRLAWTFGLCRTASVAGMLFAFFAALDVLLRFDPPLVRAGLLAAWGIAVAGVAWESLVRPLRRIPSPGRLAEQLERRFEPLSGRLAAAVEFAGVNRLNVHDSAALRGAVVASADAAVKEVDLGAVLDRTSPRQAVIHAAVAAAVLAAFATVLPETSRVAAIRFFAPFSQANYETEHGTAPPVGPLSAGRPPAVRLERVDVDAPSYALGAVEVTPERIQAPVGSKITVFGRADRPVAWASAEGLPDAESTTDGERFSVSWVLKQGGAVRIRVEDEEALSGEARTQDIYLFEDRPPVVRMTRPVEGLFAIPAAVLHVDGVAEDDFGVANVEFLLAKPDTVTGAIRERTVSLFQSSPDKTERSVPIKGREIPLADFALRPGEEVAVWIRATDVAGKTAAGAKRRIAVVSEEDALSLAQKGRQELATALEELLLRQEEHLATTRALARDWKTPPDAESTGRLQRLLQGQAEVVGALRDPVSGLLARFSRLAEVARINAPATEEIGFVLNQVEEVFIRPAGGFLDAIQAELGRARVQRDEAPARLDAAANAQQAFVERWKGALELLRRQEAYFNLGEALDGLILKQEESRARLGLLLPKTRGQDADTLPSGLHGELAVEARQQKELLDLWMLLVARLSEEESLADLADTSIARKMNEAVEAIEANRLEGAIQSQDAVLLALAEVRARLRESFSRAAADTAAEASKIPPPTEPATEGSTEEGTEGTPGEGTEGSRPAAPSESGAEPSAVEAAARAAELMEGLWGMLPARERAAVRQLPGAAFPPEYARLIEAYFRALSQEKIDESPE